MYLRSEMWERWRGQIFSILAQHQLILSWIALHLYNMGFWPNMLIFVKCCNKMLIFIFNFLWKITVLDTWGNKKDFKKYLKVTIKANIGVEKFHVLTCTPPSPVMLSVVMSSVCVCVCVCVSQGLLQCRLWWVSSGMTSPFPFLRPSRRAAGPSLRPPSPRPPRCPDPSLPPVLHLLSFI